MSAMRWVRCRQCGTAVALPQWLVHASQAGPAAAFVNMNCVIHDIVTFTQVEVKHH